ncbi:MAG: hypothetical protein ABIG60_04120 [Patescibacteria group bacterium]
MDIKIGFIGQGWIGKNYADNFEDRKYTVIRYSLEEKYINNGTEIKNCDIVFIAVPTPTSPKGFDDSILREAIKKIGKGKIAVIKSTTIPGTVEKLQKENPNIYILNSPEFLTTQTARYDADNPARNIIGLPIINEDYKEKAKVVMNILPKAPFELICSAREAELIKYGGNCLSYVKIIFINLLYDLVEKYNCNWEIIKEAMMADPRIGNEHLNPVHKGGRGAGGYCFIKDFAALTEIYKKMVGDELGFEVLSSIKNKNIDLLVNSNKDLDLLSGVYGKDVVEGE